MNPLATLQSNLSKIFNPPTKTQQPFYPTPTGAPIPKTSTPISSQMATVPKPTSTVPKPSSFNPAVLAQQQALNAKGAGLKLDGIMGPLTQAAIAKYATPQNNTQQGSTVPTPNVTESPTAPKNRVIDTPTNPYESQYQALLGSSPEVDKAQQAIDTQNNALRGGLQKIEDKPIDMGFIRGQQASLEARNTNLQIPLQQQLANAQRQRQSSLDAVKFGLDRYDKTQTAKNQLTTVGEGSSVYDSAGNLISTAPSSSGSSSSNGGVTLSPGEIRFEKDPVTGQLKQVASGGAKPMSQAQETANIANTEKETAAQQSASQSIGLVNNLLSGDAYKAITGIGQNPLNALGLSNASSINQYDQLQGLLKLGIRGLLKGQGAVSDYEGRVLGQAASALGRNLSNEDFKQALLKIRGTLQTNNGGETSVIVTDTNGKQFSGILNGQDIYDAVNKGYTIKYQ